MWISITSTGSINVSSCVYTSWATLGGGTSIRSSALVLTSQVAQ